MTSFLRRIRVVLSVAFLFALVACSDGRQADADRRVVRIAGIATPYKGASNFGSLPQIVIQQGWLARSLKEHGWTVEWVPIAGAVGGPMINEGFANASIDLAIYGDLPAVIANAAGVESRLLLPNGSGGTHVYVIVGAGSHFQRIEDLKGRTIALHRGRPWEAVFVRLLASKRLSLNDFRIVNVSPPAGAAALAAGKVDAFIAYGTDTWKLVSTGVGRAIWSSKEVPLSWRSGGGLFARKPFLDAHADIANIVTEAFVRASDWAARDENRAQYIALSARDGIPEAVIAAEMDDGRPWSAQFIPPNRAQLLDQYGSVIAYARDSGLIQGSVDAATIIDTARMPQPTAKPSVR